MSTGPHDVLIEALRLIESREWLAAERSLLSIDEIGQCALEQKDRILYDILLNECRAFMGRAQQTVPECTRITSCLANGAEHSLYARACFVLAVARHHLGQLEEAVGDCNNAIFSYLRVGNLAGASRALNWLGNTQFNMSDYQSALKSYKKCEDLATRAESQRTAAVVRFNTAKPLALSGALSEAASLLEANGRFMETHANRLNSLRQDLFRGFVLIQLRQYEAARQVLGAFGEGCDTLPQREQGAWCEYMGELELAEGNLGKAEEHLLHGVSLASGESHDESVIGQSRRLLAEARLAQGNPTEAIAESERALQSIVKVGERFEEGVVYRILGQARLELGQEAEPRADFKHSIGILRDIGARFELAKSCLVAGSAAVFSRRERLAYLVEAERLFGEIGVEYWTEQTRESLKQVLNDREVELQAQAAVEPVISSTLFITADRTTLQTLHLAECYARTDIGVLITGETGVGKDQLARYIHSISPRRERPFVPIDLNTIPETLLESTLFGHRKGSFTGAAGERIGLLETANGGTVFFNEIGNLSPAFQARLLEVLDTRQVRRLGESKAISLDIRFIAATNADMTDAVSAGQFRSDLYYRFAEAPLHLLPLRERRADIVPLIRHFLMELSLPASELALLDRQLWVDRAHNGHWDGNVRRLRSFVRQLVAIAERPSDPEFPGWGARLLEQMDVIAEPNIGARVSRDTLVEALGRNQWNQRATARVLGITEGGIRHLMRRLSIQRPEMA